MLEEDKDFEAVAIYEGRGGAMKLKIRRNGASGRYVWAITGAGDREEFRSSRSFDTQTDCLAHFRKNVFHVTETPMLVIEEPPPLADDEIPF